MNSQIVDPKRYKKTTREKSDKKKIAQREELKKQEKVQRKIKENRINKSKKDELSYIKLNGNSDKITVDFKKHTKRTTKRKQNNII